MSTMDTQQYLVCYRMCLKLLIRASVTMLGGQYLTPHIEITNLNMIRHVTFHIEVIL